MSKSTRKLWAAHIACGGRPTVKRAQTEVRLGAPFRGRVLGIDPSLRGSGFAVLDYSADGTARILEAATLKIPPKISMAECLGAIGNQVDDFLNQHSIDHVAVEQTIYVQNFQTAQILGAARGAAIGTAAMRGLPVFEYAPLRIKQAVVGMGRASKEQVARTIQNITGTNFELRFDESDAAAVALCHAFTWRGH
ncbi:MAG: crossover junction endodeoxyribonuclease RuvC [Puniceicoccaceae bacterium]|jgi:crossover junction endodeoxyribonuclease RuvC|nr:crossover junction endodeoxyribonuclease RuvC [Puniceicoccaceae bacterium]MBL6839026.1 crossover junction endodeoxyribonuclease RuvC [Puniceicoccaceae bacterium]MBL6913658.1 crossover junction endodeoxyribonuclease RuvC [Puniceicoccaceae bacterium]